MPLPQVNVCEVFHTIHMGLWVLWTEIRWIAGQDWSFRKRISLLQRQQNTMQSELACMTTLADNRRQQRAIDLSLLEEDLIRLQTEQENRRVEIHRALCNRFPDVLNA